jgi:hypothetical protein
MAKTVIKFGAVYKYQSDMIKAAIEAGFKHVSGRGFACRNCGHKYSVRKFLKGRATMYACNKCRARWGSVVK